MERHFFRGRRTLPCLALLVAIAVLAIAGAALAPNTASGTEQVGNKILAHKLAVMLGTERARGKEMPVSAGVMYTLLEGTGVIDHRAAA